MTARLADVNLLLALAWPNHMHHQMAHEWLERLGSDQWATCAITQCGFIRVSANTKFTPHAASPREAARLLSLMTEDPRHVFWRCDLSWGDAALSIPNLVGHQQVTDAYLLALAGHHDGRVVTFDRAFKSLAGTAAERVELLG